MDWKKGYDIEYLKELSAAFRYQKKLVYGAFGLVKERDIATALSESRCCYNKAKSAVVISKVLQRGSKKTDFTGNKIIIPEETFYIQSFAAANTKDADIILEEVLSRVNTYNEGMKKTQDDLGIPVYERWGIFNSYIEILEEDEVCKQAVLSRGFIYKGTRISAGSELYGIYGLEGSEKTYSVQESAELLELEKNYITEKQNDAILSEIESYNNFYQHYSSYNKKKSWTAFAIKGYIKNDPSFIIKPGEMSKKWKKENSKIINNKPEWLDISSMFPETIKIAEELGETERVRFMKLGAGGELTRHADITDRNAGVEIGKIVRLHIPIKSTKDVINKSWDARGNNKYMNFEKNGLYYLDQRKPHCVKNNSSQERINLVIDLKSNNKIIKMLQNGL